MEKPEKSSHTSKIESKEQAKKVVIEILGSGWQVSIEHLGISHVPPVISAISIFIYIYVYIYIAPPSAADHNFDGMCGVEFNS